MIYRLLIFGLLAGIVLCCKQGDKHEQWAYSGENDPKHWSELEVGSACSGTRQSPINIIAVDAVKDESLGPIGIDYSSNLKIDEITNNGHSIQYNFDKGDFVELQGERYQLQQFHFHGPSEHTVNGIRFPLEIHLVHSNEVGKLAVVSVLVMEGESSVPFTFIEQYLPIEVGETKAVGAEFDLEDTFVDSAYYTYSGSLTTPPCSEDVSWHVFKKPLTATSEQIERMTALMPVDNYRGVQPLNGRTIKLFEGQ